jgi:hypothetical protein
MRAAEPQARCQSWSVREKAQQLQEKAQQW